MQFHVYFKLIHLCILFLSFFVFDFIRFSLLRKKLFDNGRCLNDEGKIKCSPMSSKFFADIKVKNNDGKLIPSQSVVNCLHHGNKIMWRNMSCEIFYSRALFSLRTRRRYRG